MLPIKYAGLVLLLIYLIVKGIIPGWNAIVTDFPNYYVSAQQVIKGEGIEKLYDDHWFQQRIYDSGIDALGKFSPQPPIAATVLTPLAYFEPLTAKRIWLILSLTFMVGAIVLVHKLFSFSLLDSSLAILLMGRALSNDLYYGQLYLLVTFSMLFALWLIQSRNAQVLAGIILAVVAILKYFPVLVIFYALLIKKYSVVVASLATFLALGVLQLIIFGWDVMQFYIGEILPAHLSGNIPGQGAFAIAYQSWPSFLNNLFVYNSGFNPSPVYSWATGQVLGIVAIYTSIVLMSGYYLKKIKTAHLGEIVKRNWLITLLIVTGLILLPATASYHFLFLLIPFCLFMKGEIDKYKLLILVLVVAINFLPYPFQSNENIIMLILSYPRLMAISGILIITYFRINQLLKLET